MQTVNVWAIDKSSNRVVHINEVVRGNACKCKCLNCNADLQARKGEERAAHFKHINGDDCSAESILHKLAKKVFTEANYLKLPGDKPDFFYTVVKEEVWLDDHRPDIVLYGSDKQLNVEIAVTSFVTAVKRSKIKKGGKNTIEIDLSDLERHTSYEQIKYAILEETGRKAILNWSDGDLRNCATTEESKSWLIPLAVVVVGLICWFYYKKPKLLRVFK